MPGSYDQCLGQIKIIGGNAMPKPVCAKCECEFIPKQNDVRVVEYFLDPPQPYKLWCADLWACPKCGFEIVTGFGNNAYAEHFQEGFTEMLEDVNKRGERRINVYERRNK
jgi:hypothetical protein